MTTASPSGELAVARRRRAATRPPGYWGMVVLIATEASIFGALLSAYFFTRASSPTWPQGGIAPPELGRITFFTVVLLASSVPLFYAEAAIRRGRVGALRIGLAISFVLGVAFVVNQVIEFHDLGFSAKDNAYASLFVVITGLHGLHLIAGLLISVVVQLKAGLGWFDRGRHLTVTVFCLYWHFVDVVWIFVYASLYLSAHVR
ncbi:MAG TPA: cytochrome c oxidase subunit 3 [Ilumatobacteraceae bacterium]